LTKINLGEEINKITHTRRLFDLLFTAKIIEQEDHRKMVSYVAKQLALLTKISREKGVDQQV